MTWILWLLILMFVLLTLPTREGGIFGKVSKGSSNAANAFVSESKKVSSNAAKAIVGAANATAAFAVATTTGKTSNSNKTPEDIKIDPKALKCASPNDTGKWYKVKHATEGRGTGIYDSKNEIRCDFTKYPPATKFNECIHSAAPNIPVKSMKKHPISEITDNNLKSIYYLGHPNRSFAGINDGCKWNYVKHKKGLNLNSIISNTLVEDVVL